MATADVTNGPLLGAFGVKLSPRACKPAEPDPSIPALGFAGAESAGASFMRRDGSVWTTDKDGLVPALLAAEMTARMGRDPASADGELTREPGEPVYVRLEAPATPEQKDTLAKLSPAHLARVVEEAQAIVARVLAPRLGHDTVTTEAKPLRR